MIAALINRRRKGGGVGLCLALLLLLSLPSASQAVLVETLGASVTVGDTLDVVVQTEDLTGLGVYSYEMDLSWNANVLTMIDVIEAGTITLPWGDAVFSTGPGVAHIAAAGSSTLAGAGTLLLLRFVAGPSSGGTYVTIGDFLFNEGTPAATTDREWITISALPTINVSPDAAEILVGGTLQMSVSGGTSPYTWGVTDGVVASIDPTGLLTGLAPGATRVFAEDAVAIRDTTTSDILVRAMSITAPPSISAGPGASFTIPIDVTDLTGLDVRSFEFEMTFSATQLVVTGANFTGTLAGTWGAPTVWTESGQVRIAAANAVPLTSSGVLINLECMVPPTATSSTTLNLQSGLFDERFVPLHVDGWFTVDNPPNINIAPNTATVLVGNTQQFTVSGVTTPPLTWGTTDAGVGTIDATGLFTPVAGGDCFVFVEDAVGARDTTGVISVCDLSVYIPNTVVQTAVTQTAVPILVDRDVTGLGIYGFEVTISYNSSRVHAVAATDSASLSAVWGPGIITVNTYADSITIAHAGGSELTGQGALAYIYFEADPGATHGQTSAATFRTLVLNEGHPVPCTQNGTLTVDDTLTGILGPWTESGIRLAQNRPNPFARGTVIQYSVTRERMNGLALSILDARGRLVRHFDLSGAAAGPGLVEWDGRDGQGSRVSSGVYFYRLSGGGEDDVRKMVLIR